MSPSAELGVAGKEADLGRNIPSSLWGGVWLKFQEGFKRTVRMCIRAQGQSSGLEGPVSKMLGFE